MLNGDSIEVSIIMLTFNHEKFVGEAIDSILNQDFKKKYEIIIGDDCSTDRTCEVLDRYQRNNPNIIKVIKRKKNVGALDNEADIRERCRGKYIAVLEGDDYWEKNYKLTKQIEFLDNHPDYIGCAHNVDVIDEYGKKMQYAKEGFHIKGEHIYSKENALRFEMIGHISGWVYRNIWKDMSEEELIGIRRCKANADYKLSIVLGLKGQIYFFQETMSVYRRRFSGDGWSASTVKRNMTLYYMNADLEIAKLLFDYYGIYVNLMLRSERYFQESKRILKEKPRIGNIYCCIVLLLISFRLKLEYVIKKDEHGILV